MYESVLWAWRRPHGYGGAGERTRRLDRIDARDPKPQLNDRRFALEWSELYGREALRRVSGETRPRRALDVRDAIVRSVISKREALGGLFGEAARNARQVSSVRDSSARPAQHVPRWKDIGWKTGGLSRRPYEGPVFQVQQRGRQWARAFGTSRQLASKANHDESQVGVVAPAVRTKNALIALCDDSEPPVLVRRNRALQLLGAPGVDDESPRGDG